jgi:hypothetical protein
MTYSEIISILDEAKERYQRYMNEYYNVHQDLCLRQYYIGLAITNLQDIADIFHKYPAIAAKVKGNYPDCTDLAIYHLIDKQRALYVDRLRELKKRIKDGTYNLDYEMSIKLTRLRDANRLVNGNDNINVPAGAVDARNDALLSVAGTALKYPVHAVSKVLQGGAKLLGKLITIPLHMVGLPIHMIFNKSPYDGKVVNEIGETFGNIISSGVRVIDNGIMRL